MGTPIQILAEQQPPQEVSACDYAGLVINRFSRAWRGWQRGGAALYRLPEHTPDNLHEFLR